MSPNVLSDDTDHSPVDRALRAKRFDRHVQSSELASALVSEEARVSFINTLSADDFVALLQTINGTLMNADSKPSLLNSHVSYVGVDTAEDQVDDPIVTPAPEDRAELLGYVLEAAQSVEDVESKAMILGFGINEVHPFVDGNGRTARAVYTLLSKDYEPSDPSLLSALSERGNKDLVLSPRIFANGVSRFLQEQMHSTVNVGGLAMPHFIVRAHNPDFQAAENFTTPRREYDELATETMTNILDDEAIGPIIAHLLDLTTTYRSVRSAVKDTANRQKIFYADQFLTEASQEELDRAYKIFREVSSHQVKLFIDMLAGRQYADVLAVGHSKLREAYSFQEFGRRAANGAMLSGL